MFSQVELDDLTVYVERKNALHTLLWAIGNTEGVKVELNTLDNIFDKLYQTAVRATSQGHDGIDTTFRDLCGLRASHHSMSVCNQAYRALREQIVDVTTLEYVSGFNKQVTAYTATIEAILAFNVTESTKPAKDAISDLKQYRSCLRQDVEATTAPHLSISPDDLEQQFLRQLAGVHTERDCHALEESIKSRASAIEQRLQYLRKKNLLFDLEDCLRICEQGIEVAQILGDVRTLDRIWCSAKESTDKMLRRKLADTFHS